MILRGCPVWVGRLFYVLFAYNFLNFFLGSRLGPTSEDGDLRVFSGVWIVFYFAAWAILYSAIRLDSRAPRTCPNGHQIPPAATYCQQCGTQLPPLPVE